MSNEQMRSAVVAEAYSWLRTPYHHHARIKGERGGVDCLQLLCAVFEAAGVTPHIETGFYAREHHLHRNEEIYIEGVERYGAVEVQTPGLGDIALFQWGRTWSHGGVIVALEPELLLVHSYLGRGVTINKLSEEPLHGHPPRFWSVFR